MMTSLYCFGIRATLTWQRQSQKIQDCCLFAKVGVYEYETTANDAGRYCYYCRPACFPFFAILNKRRVQHATIKHKTRWSGFFCHVQDGDERFSIGQHHRRRSDCKYTTSFLLSYLELVSGLGVPCLLLCGGLAISERRYSINPDKDWWIYSLSLNVSV